MQFSCVSSCLECLGSSSPLTPALLSKLRRLVVKIKTSSDAQFVNSLFFPSKSAVSQTKIVVMLRSLFTSIDCCLKSGVVCLNLGRHSGILANVRTCSLTVQDKVRARSCVTPAAAAEKSFRATRTFKVLSILPYTVQI